MDTQSNLGAVNPKPSAAGIILSGGDEPRVLLVRRSAKLRFMGGHHAFPGGRIDPNEGTANVVGATDEEQARAIHALAREIFEETGLLLAQGSLPSREVIREARLRLLEENESFDRILEKWSLKIAAEEFLPAGVWITPEGSPIRFHARYYLHHHRGDDEPETITGEIDRIDWLGPREARRLWREGSIQIPAPVAYVLQQLAQFPFPEVMPHLRRTTHVSPANPGRIEYQCGVYVLPLLTPTLRPATHTNCVVIGEREFYVIDPATPIPDEQKNLKIQLDHLLEAGGKIAAVLLTHSHIDHVGAAELVRKEYGAPVWAHKAVAPQVKFTIDRFLEHDEIIRVAGDPDWRLRCLHTPGHDPGHLCFLEETTRTLMAGDMIAERGTIVISPDYSGDMTQYLESLELLLREDYDVMLPAHGLALFNPKEKVREYIGHRLDREKKIQAALDEGKKEMKELLATAYADVPKEVWPLAEHSLRAHLVRLGFPKQE